MKLPIKKRHGLKLPIKNWVIGIKGFFLKISLDTQWSCQLKTELLAFLKTSNEAAYRKSNAWSKWSCYTQTVLDFHTRGELSNRSKRRCFHEEETWVQRISLEHEHECRFYAEWQQCDYLNVVWKLLTSCFSSFPFFFAFVTT